MLKWCETIKYREIIGLDGNVTFGLELEFVKAKRVQVATTLIDLFKEGKLKKEWITKTEDTLYQGIDKDSPFGGEVTSDILTDNKKTWKELKLVCDTIQQLNGTVNNKCASHIHIGKNILEDNLTYYIRLAKLYTVFEDIILRYSYGIEENARPGMFYYAASNVQVFKHIGLFENSNLTFDDFVRAYSTSKNLAISLRNLDPKRKLNTIEIRCPNGTLNPIIWQNNVNFFTKLLLACKDDSKDWDYISQRFLIAKDMDSDDEINLEDATYLSNFIFQNDLDKLNFLKQYLKDYNELNSKVHKIV